MFGRIKQLFGKSFVIDVFLCIVSTCLVWRTGVGHLEMVVVAHKVLELLLVVGSEVPEVLDVLHVALCTESAETVEDDVIHADFRES